jgi:hypothetical protein
MVDLYESLNCTLMPVLVLAGRVADARQHVLSAFPADQDLMMTACLCLNQSTLSP